jgi:hypothetical protein
MKVSYLVKGPDILPALEKWNEISDLTVVSCLPAYVDFFKYKGYKTITIDEYISCHDKNMNFTHTLANPPFIKNLHLQFLIASCQKSLNVNIIHPAGWLFRTTKQIEKDAKKAIEGRVKKLTILNGNPLFGGAQFQCPLVITEVAQEYEDPIELHYQTTGNTYFINSLDEMPTGYWEPSENHIKLVNKFKQLTSTNSINDLVGDYSGRSFLAAPSISGDGRSQDPTKLCKKDFWTFFYSNSDMFRLKNGKKVFNVNTDAERDSLISYLKTKVARFGLSINKISVHLYIKRYLMNVPLPPLDRQWTEESIMDYYQLTHEERTLINNFIPDFY